MLGQSYIVMDVLGDRVAEWGPKKKCGGGEGDIAHRCIIMRHSRGNWVAAECKVIRPPSLSMPSASLGVPKTTLISIIL